MHSCILELVLCLHSGQGTAFAVQVFVETVYMSGSNEDRPATPTTAVAFRNSVCRCHGTVAIA